MYNYLILVIFSLKASTILEGCPLNPHSLNLYREVIILNDVTGNSTAILPTLQGRSVEMLQESSSKLA